MSIETSQDHGSMFGVVDSLNNMARALEDLLRYLPDKFVWPTTWRVSPYTIYAEWAREDTEEEVKESVWLVATPEGVRMNATFRLDWPECGASEFDAQTAANWLLELTKNWRWDAVRTDGRTQSSLSRPSMKA